MNGRNSTNDSCTQKSVQFTKFLKDNVINFIRRYNRVKSMTTFLDNKIKKKDDFRESAARLIQSTGGNKSNITCSGSTTAVGAQQATGNVTTLEECSDNIASSCAQVINNDTMAKLEECQVKAKAFNETISGCIDKSMKNQGGVCECFENSDNQKNLEALRECKGIDEQKASSKQRTKCLNALKKCKAAQKSSCVLQYACQFTKDDLVKTLATLTKNKAAYSSLAATVKELTGLSPSSRKKRNIDTANSQERTRGRRQSEVSCSTVTTTVSACATALSTSPASTVVQTSCSISVTSVTTCTTADTTAIQSALDTAAAAVVTLDVFIASVQAEISAITGAEASETEIASAGGETATTRTRDRMAWAKKLYNNKLFIKQ